MTSILVAKGRQDVYLTSNPEVSYFSSTFKRYTNFDQSVHQQVISGKPAAGTVSYVTVERVGDLLGHVYFTKKSINGVLQPDITADDIEKVELMIGDQVIDSLTTDQLVSSKYFHERLAVTKVSGYEKNGVLGFYGNYMYPLGFWFCEGSNSTLPLISLQYHDVRLRITWGGNPQDDVYFESWANYYFLDKKEREKFSEMGYKSDTIIYQHQEQEVSGNGGLSLSLNFNNPVYCIYSKLGKTDIFGKNMPNVSDKLAINVNGTTVSSQKEIHPHYTVAPSMYNTRWGVWPVNEPISNVVVTTNLGGTVDTVTVEYEANRISFFYPFCININNQQLSGSCNFSRIDSCELKTTSMIVKPIYARSMNVLRIQDGMGGLIFSS